MTDPEIEAELQERLRAALQKIAFEPLGVPTTSDLDFIRKMEEVAKAALLAEGGKGEK